MVKLLVLNVKAFLVHNWISVILSQTNVEMSHVEWQREIAVKGNWNSINHIIKNFNPAGLKGSSEVGLNLYWPHVSNSAEANITSSVDLKSDVDVASSVVEGSVIPS